MWGTFLLSLVFLVLCGFIAYLGDFLGTKLGKKRVTLFKLRPKHSAIVLTVATGPLIALLTFGLVFLTQPWFRDMVLRGERLARMNRRLASLIQEQERTNAERQAVSDRLSASNTRLRNSNLGLSTENRRLGTANRLLEQRGEKLQQEVRDLRGNSERLRRENSALIAVRDTAARENKRLLAESAGLRRETARVRRDLVEIRKVAEMYRTQEYVFERGTQLAVQQILPNPPEDVVQGAIESILFTAQQLARTRGAASGRDGTLLELVRAPDAPPGSPEDPKSIRSRVLRQALLLRNQPLALAVRAELNSIRGQPVRVRLECYPDPQVLSTNQEVARAVFDGNSTTGQLFGDLQQFLRNNVVQVATSPPLEIRPTLASIGEQTYDQLLEVCDQIRRIGAPTVVVARARQVTRRSGPLNLWFQVLPADRAAPPRG